MDRQWSPEIVELGDQIACLPCLVALELKDYLKEKYNIEPAGGMPVVGPPPQDMFKPEKPPEKTEFDVVLEGFDQTKKIGVVKVLREQTGLGLKESMAITTDLPRTLKTAVSKDEAEKCKKLLEEAGAKISIK